MVYFPTFYIPTKNQGNVGEYTIHGWYGDFAVVVVVVVDIVDIPATLVSKGLVDSKQAQEHQPQKPTSSSSTKPRL